MRNGNRHWIGIVSIMLLACAMSKSSASAVSITLDSEKDNTIFQNNVNNSLGVGQTIFAGTNGTSSPRRGLIAFDVADSIPAGSTITSVQLTLFLNQVAGGGGGTGSGGSGGATISLYNLTRNWGEGTSGSGTLGTSGTGQGYPATQDDATWNDSTFSTSSPTAWTNPGGDFSATAQASASVGNTLNMGYTWGSNAAMVADVQSWLDSPSTNYGWILINNDETDSQTFRAFWTREASLTQVDAQYVPQLVVTYVPEPVESLTLMMGLFVLSRRRSRSNV